MNIRALEFYKEIAPEIENFCKPLNQYFNIICFSYFRIYHDATYILFSNNIELTQKYYLTVMNDTIYRKRYIESRRERELILWPETPQNFMMQIASDMGYGNGITLSNVSDQGIECFDFISYKENHKINNFYYEYYAVLEAFIEHFKSQFKNSIYESTFCRASYQDKFSKVSRKSNLNLYDINSFRDETEMDGAYININENWVYFSFQEVLCLKLLHKNCSKEGLENEMLLFPDNLEELLCKIRTKFYNNK